MKPLDVNTTWPADVDEHDTHHVLHDEKPPLSPCAETLVSASLSTSSSWSPPTTTTTPFTMEVRGPSPASGRCDFPAEERKDLSSDLDIPTMTAETDASSLSSLICSMTPTGVEVQQESDTQASTVWKCTRKERVPSRQEASTSPGEALGFSKEMSKAFADGTLLPYFLSLLTPPPAIQDEQGTSWNGHLPLAPFPAGVEEEDHNKVQWAMPRSRRKRRLPTSSGTTMNHSPQHTIFPTTLSDPNQVEILFYCNDAMTVCFSNSLFSFSRFLSLWESESLTLYYSHVFSFCHFNNIIE